MSDLPPKPVDAAAAAIDAAAPKPVHGARRIFGNLGLLLGGKAGAGLISLVYLVIVARSLGARDYGVLILVHGYVTLVGGIIAFSGWHGLVRYGTIALEEKNPARLLRMIRFMALIELGCAVVAIAVASVLATLVGPHLGWSSATVRFAIPYSLAIIAMARATPQGILQIVGRFDLIGAHQLVSPGVRLIGAVIAWASGAGLIGFLCAWLTAAIFEGAAMWALGLWQMRKMALGGGFFGTTRGVVAENPGVLPFIITTNVDITLQELAPRIAPLTVGWMLGPVGAGVLNLAQKASTVLQQPATLLGQASYAVLARMVSTGQYRGLKTAVWKSALWAVCIATPVLILLAAFGRPILGFLGGHSFTGGTTLLVLIAAARVAGVAAPPFIAGLTAMGKPSLSITVNLLANLALYPLLPLLIWWLGPDGAGWHAIVQSLFMLSAMAWLFRRTAAVRLR